MVNLWNDVVVPSARWVKTNAKAIGQNVAGAAVIGAVAYGGYKGVDAGIGAYHKWADDSKGKHRYAVIEEPKVLDVYRVDGKDLGNVVDLKGKNTYGDEVDTSVLAPKLADADKAKAKAAKGFSKTGSVDNHGTRSVDQIKLYKE